MLQRAMQEEPPVLSQNEAEAANSRLGHGLWDPALGLSSRGIFAFLALHVAIWTVVPTVAGSTGVLHIDMTEAYAWGQEFQLGYTKHPPVFPWVAGAWFSVFPRTQWAFFLLSAVAAAVGLAGVWLLAGRLLSPAHQTAALLLSVLTPFFNTLAATFNANSILLLVWPWTVYAFVRSIDTGRRIDAILFGALAALALLSKYSSILLLVVCFAAALLHPRARGYFASPAPYLAMAVAGLLFAPHLLWAIGNHLSTVNYVLEKEHIGRLEGLQLATTSMLGALAFLGLAALAFVTAAGRSWASSIRAAVVAAGSPQWRWLTVLALGPSLLTVLAGLAIGIKVSSNFLIPAFFVIPVAILAHSGLVFGPDQLKVLRRFVTGWFVVALIGAPLFAFAVFARQSDLTTEPRAEIAVYATRAWREATGRPPTIAGGSAAYGLGLPFYSPDRLRYYDIHQPSATPWITSEMIASQGVLIVCQDGDSTCADNAGRLPAASRQLLRIRLSHQVLAWRSPEFGFEVHLLLPVANP